MTQHKPGKKIRREKAEQPPRHADLGLRVAVAGGFDHLRANRLGLAQIGRGHLFQRASGRAQANARPLAHEERSAQLVFKLTMLLTKPGTEMNSFLAAEVKLPVRAISRKKRICFASIHSPHTSA